MVLTTEVDSMDRDITAAAIISGFSDRNEKIRSDIAVSFIIQRELKHKNEQKCGGEFNLALL